MPPCYLNVTSNISIDAKISTHMCKPLSKFHNVVTWISIIIELNLHKELTNFSESLGRYFWWRGQGKCQFWKRSNWIFLIVYWWNNCII